MMKKWKLLLVSGLAVMTLAACNSEDKAVVELKSGDITQKEFYDALKERYGAVVLDELVQKSVVYDKYKVTDKELEERLQYYKDLSGIDTDEDFENQVLSAGYKSLDEFKDALKFNTAQVKALTDGIKIDEAKIKEAYEEQKTQISASHILVTDEALATEIYNKIKNGKATFEEMVLEHSTDTTTQVNNGSLGFFPKGTMVEEFETVAFNMKKGEISEPVQTQYGFHIIRIDNIKEEKYETLKVQIEEDLKLEQAKDYNQVLRDLLKENKFNIKDKDLKKTYEDYQPAASDEEKAKDNDK